ncbi:MAG: hypothetical protein HC824_17210 [Synechococcales cyanobacterium RM1_1_8]|nr:hypothetical protein [Synechococcales cyanobacterium RM1_1_8]
MEVAVAAIALITFFCGRSVCCEPSPKLKLKSSRDFNLTIDDYQDYMAYVAMEDQLQKEQLQQLKQLYRR